jgi:hypothetical protein
MTPNTSVVVIRTQYLPIVGEVRVDDAFSGQADERRLPSSPGFDGGGFGAVITRFASARNFSNGLGSLVGGGFLLSCTLAPPLSPTRD